MRFSMRMLAGLALASAFTAGALGQTPQPDHSARHAAFVKMVKVMSPRADCTMPQPHLTLCFVYFMGPLGNDRRSYYHLTFSEPLTATAERACAHVVSGILDPAMDVDRRIHSMMSDDRTGLSCIVDYRRA